MLSPPPESGKGSAIRKILVVLVIVVVIAGVTWKIHKNSTEQVTTARGLNAASDRPIPVLVASVESKTMPIYLTALGTVIPYNSVTIKSRVDGQLMSVPVREGQKVSKGQVLAEIDARPYEAALAQAQGQLVKDQANAKNAEAEAARYTALLDAGVVSKESQQSQLSMAGQAAGSIASDEAAIQAAKVNVAYTKITSPIDGVIGLRQVDPGNIVHASDANGLLLVTQLQPVSVIFTLPEDQLPEVLKLQRSGQKLVVNAYDRSQSMQLGTGMVLTLDNQIDSTTGTDKVKAIFPNKDGALFPNQFVNVRLILQQRQNAIVVPAAAIETGSQGSFVYVVKPGYPPGAKPAGSGGSGGATGAGGGAGSGNRPAAGAGGASGASGGRGGRGGGANGAPFYVVAQNVQVDVTEGTQVILSGGVNPGDQIVVDGQEKLLPNSRVAPTKQSATAAGAPATSSSQGEGTAAFGPEGSGPSEPSSHPHKQGLEEGSGIPASGRRGQNGGGQGQGAGAGGDHPHRRQNQTGQQP